MVLLLNTTVDIVFDTLHLKSTNGFVHKTCSQNNDSPITSQQSLIINMFLNWGGGGEVREDGPVIVGSPSIPQFNTPD